MMEMEEKRGLASFISAHNEGNNENIVSDITQVTYQALWLSIILLGLFFLPVTWVNLIWYFGSIVG